MRVSGNTEVQPAAKAKNSFGMRHFIIFQLFMVTTVAYATRVSVSLAIVAMTSENDYGYPILDWEKSVQDTILSSFFWGYIVLQIPAGLYSGKFGGKVFITLAMVNTGLFNLVTPLAATKGGWMAMCACRILMGLSQGILFPTMHNLLGQWTPTTERSRMITFVYAGAQLGTIIEMMTAGVLSAGPWGWPSVFYVAGITCVVLAAIWTIFGASTPSTCRWISTDERKYIEMNVSSAHISKKKKMPTPWKSIWTSLPFWAIIITHCSQSLGYFTLLTEIPSYLSKVFGVNIKNNGKLSALPYAAMYIFSFVFSWTSDYVVNRNIISLPIARKTFNTIAFWGPAASLLVLSYIPSTHVELAVAILMITLGLNAARYVGFMISHIDLSPNFAGVLMGITNSCGTIFSIMAPLSVSLVVKDETSASEWRKVFFISVVFYFVSNLFFILFMSGRVQDWNEPQLSKISGEEILMDNFGFGGDRKVMPDAYRLKSRGGLHQRYGIPGSTKTPNQMNN